MKVDIKFWFLSKGIDESLLQARRYKSHKQGSKAHVKIILCVEFKLNILVTLVGADRKGAKHTLVSDEKKGKTVGDVYRKIRKVNLTL